MKKLSFVFILSIVPVLLTACMQGPSSSDEQSAEAKKELLIYSGITMVRPLQKLADEFSAQNNINIKIIQGASGFILETLKKEKNGDIYFPGSSKFCIENRKNGLITNYMFVGYNRLALIVPKGNPKHLTADLHQLTDPNLSVVISSPEASSVGQATDQALVALGIQTPVFENITYFTTDSHRIYDAIRSGHADVAVNWFATSKWAETIDQMDSLIIDDKIAPKRKLELNLLSFSKQPQVALDFMRYASSAHGLKTFAEFGFLTEDELQYFLQNPPQIMPPEADK